MTSRWQFWIDRGGTFTDCIGVDPATGAVVMTKVLSSDRAPITGIRQLLDLDANAAIPPCDIRMGTTVATNALLERRGAPCALAITRGLTDLLAIGDQTRPDLFALAIDKPAPLTNAVVALDERLAASGERLAEHDPASLRSALAAILAQGNRSLAICIMNSYLDPAVEHRVAEVARALGFDHVVTSCDTSRELGILPRAQTAVVDAYLTPVLHRYLDSLAADLADCHLQCMQSSGGLTDAAHFRGPNAILSGPAGGVVACAEVGRRGGESRVIGFDMGGTSTDVCCIDGGDPDLLYHPQVAGVSFRAPTLDIHTVAAGGGSLCLYRGHRLTVGPESAGADPGPLCYGRAGDGSGDLTLTDIDLALGRLVGDRFPFALQLKPVTDALAAMAESMGAESSEKIAEGFAEVANANMAEAVRQVSIARGRNPEDFALVVFGGAGGQHACAVARALKMKSVLFDSRAGVLSAWGMGLADVHWYGDADAGRQVLGENLLAELEPHYAELEQRGRREIARSEGDTLTVVRTIDLRYVGTDSPINVPTGGALAEAFEQAHKKLYGYKRSGHPIEATTLRLDLRSRRPAMDLADKGTTATGTPEPRRSHTLFCGGAWIDCPLYYREDLGPGQRLKGPAVIADPLSILVVDPDFELEVVDAHLLRATDTRAERPVSDDTRLDPVRLEIFANGFMSVAKQMGSVLERTAISTNIRDRLDFSCALFDSSGGLVANAPHIPVHLGAMGESVRAVIEAHPSPPPGSAFATNDPTAGGSHLPDITVVTPVHDPLGNLQFFTASRGHHADVGGTTPGSMPPEAKSLDEEGIVLAAMPLVADGQLRRQEILDALGAGPYPARRPKDNLADLEAQLAANWTGARLLQEMCDDHGAKTVIAYMGHVQDNAAQQVAEAIYAIADGDYQFSDSLDDGTAIAVNIEIRGSQMTVDLTQCGPEHEGNLNAPRAVSVAAVLYVLRCMVGTNIPLNSGFLRPVTIRFAERSVVSPGPTRAVAGGNVETSQRLVDVLLGALGLAAASQGTMNNLTLGDSSFGYYETLGGGSGATAEQAGASAVQTHMTNTRMTDPEVLEARYPLRILESSIRRGSGGGGHRTGGDGQVRQLLALAPLSVSIVSERRTKAPFGLGGGLPGQPGRNSHNGITLPGRTTIEVKTGDTVKIETPGGGGYGPPE